MVRVPHVLHTDKLTGELRRIAKFTPTAPHVQFFENAPHVQFFVRMEEIPEI